MRLMHAFNSLLICFVLLLSHMGVAAQQTVDRLDAVRVAIDSRDYARAESDLASLVKEFPNDPFVFYELARLYDGTGRIEQARNVYQQIANIPAADQTRFVLVKQLGSSKSGSGRPARVMTTLSREAQERLDSLSKTVAVAVQSAVATPPAPQSAGANATAASRETAARAAVNKWVQAWKNKNLDAYFASYTEGFKGDAGSHAKWRAGREERIGRQNGIEIELKDIHVDSKVDARMEVSFEQIYSSDAYKDRTQKTLSLVAVGDRWLIAKEQVQRKLK